MPTPTRCTECGTVEYWYHGVRMNQTPVTKPEWVFPTYCEDCHYKNFNEDGDYIGETE